jgi:hypothetical protein
MSLQGTGIFKDLVQATPSASRPPGERGRPANPIVVKLSIKYMHARSGKSFYGCITKANGCTWLRSGFAQQSRVLRHATTCRHINSELKSFANDAAADNSLGAKLTAAVGDSRSMGGTSDSVQTRAEQPATKKPKIRSSLDRSFVDYAKNQGQKQLQTWADHCIVKLICVNGLVPTILDSDEWNKFMAIVCPRYKVTSSRMFTEKYIPNEAAHVRSLVAKRLKAERNLTLTFDGTTNRRL